MVFLTHCQRVYTIRQGPDNSRQEEPATRLDRWLWAARFFKTRQLAAGSLRAGHVAINGRKAKPATGVKRGDWLDIRKDRFSYRVEVLDIRDRRVSAELARGMYRESEQSVSDREQLTQLLSAERKAVRYDDHKPSKRDRRIQERVKRLSE